MVDRPQKLTSWKPTLQRVTFVCEHPEVVVHDSSTWARRIDIHGIAPPKWSTRVARARVDWWLETKETSNEPLLLVGRRVCRAFHIDPDAPWFEWYGVASHPHAMITWTHRTEGDELVRMLTEGELPSYEWLKKEQKKWSG